MGDRLQVVQEVKNCTDKPEEVIFQQMQSDEQLYEISAKELAQSPRQGLLIKCMANSDGDENRGKALYIKTRVAEMKEEIRERLKKQKAEEKEAMKQAFKKQRAEEKEAMKQSETTEKPEMPILIAGIFLLVFFISLALFLMLRGASL